MASGYKLYEMPQAFGCRIYFFTTYSSRKRSILSAPGHVFLISSCPPVDPSSLFCFSGDSTLDFSYKLTLKLSLAELLQPN